MARLKLEGIQMVVGGPANDLEDPGENQEMSRDLDQSLVRLG